MSTGPTDTKILQELLSQSVLVPCQNLNAKLSVTLQEASSNSCCLIRNAPMDLLVIKADDFPAPTHFFKGDKGECKRADFMLISEEKKVVIYIEIKSGNQDASYIIKQLKGASCLFAYCREIGRQFWNKKHFLDSYTPYFVGIVNLTRKQPSRVSKHTASSFLKLSAPKKSGIFFNQLMAG